MSPAKNTGGLSEHDLQHLAEHAMANATVLLDEAELLFKHGRLGRAAALAVFSVEEFGKAQLCHVWAFHREHGRHEQTRQPFWDAFATHPDKVDMFLSLIDGLVRCGEPAVWRHGAMTAHLSKLACLYVDWLPDRHVLTTPENVTQEEATQFMEMAPSGAGVLAGSWLGEALTSRRQVVEDGPGRVADSRAALPAYSGFDAR